MVDDGDAGTEAEAWIVVEVPCKVVEDGVALVLETPGVLVTI